MVDTYKILTFHHLKGDIDLSRFINFVPAPNTFIYERSLGYNLYDSIHVSYLISKNNKLYYIKSYNICGLYKLLVNNSFLKQLKLKPNLSFIDNDNTIYCYNEKVGLYLDKIKNI